MLFSRCNTAAKCRFPLEQNGCQILSERRAAFGSYIDSPGALRRPSLPKQCYHSAYRFFGEADLVVSRIRYCIGCLDSHVCMQVRMAGSVGKKASALVASDPDKKRLAEKSFTSYVRAVQLMPNKQVRCGATSTVDLNAADRQCGNNCRRVRGARSVCGPSFTPTCRVEARVLTPMMFLVPLDHQAFRLSELPLEEYAFSLGLAAAPRVPGLEKALVNESLGGGGEDREGGPGDGGGGAENEKQREEARTKKNVNRSLQRLKEQIKADKLRKRLEVMGYSGVFATRLIDFVECVADRPPECSS